MKAYPIPSVDDANRFFDEFGLRHPEINQLLVSKVYFEDGHIGAFQPARMDDELYAIFTRYKNRWLFKNGFSDEQEDLIYVPLNDGDNHGIRAIDTRDIIEIKGISDKLSSIKIKEFDMEEPITIFVKQFVEDLRKNVYIF